MKKLTVPEKLYKIFPSGTVRFYNSVDMPFEYIFNYDRMTPQEIMAVENAEIRRILVQKYTRRDFDAEPDKYGEYPIIGQGIAQFLIDGGGTLVMKPVDEYDDQSCELWQLQFKGASTANGAADSMYLLKMTDGTAHPHLAKKSGFTPDGRKIYVAGYPDITKKELKKYLSCMWDVVGFTYGKEPGQYRPKIRT